MPGVVTGETKISHLSADGKALNDYYGTMEITDEFLEFMATGKYIDRDVGNDTIFSLNAENSVLNGWEPSIPGYATYVSRPTVRFDESKGVYVSEYKHRMTNPDTTIKYVAVKNSIGLHDKGQDRPSTNNVLCMVSIGKIRDKFGNVVRRIPLGQSESIEFHNKLYIDVSRMAVTVRNIDFEELGLVDVKITPVFKVRNDSPYLNTFFPIHPDPENDFAFTSARSSYKLCLEQGRDASESLTQATYDLENGRWYPSDFKIDPTFSGDMKCYFYFSTYGEDFKPLPSNENQLMGYFKLRKNPDKPFTSTITAYIERNVDIPENKKVNCCYLQFPRNGIAFKIHFSKPITKNRIDERVFSISFDLSYQRG